MRIRSLPYPLFLSFSFLVMSSLPFSSSSSAQAQQNENVCRDTVLEAKKRIEDDRPVEVTSIEGEDISQGYPDHPDGRPYKLQFAISGSAEGAIMNSPVMLQDIAQSLFEACNDLGMFSVGVYGTGWIISLGRTNDGSIIFFECREPGEGLGNPLTWGEMYCT